MEYALILFTVLQQRHKYEYNAALRCEKQERYTKGYEEKVTHSPQGSWNMSDSWS